jgi:hypothetical protein
MSALICCRARWRWSGGKSRVGDPAADGADGARGLDAVGVYAGLGGGGADQGADREAGQEVAPRSCLTMSGDCDRKILPGPRRKVLSWAFAVSIGHR